MCRQHCVRLGGGSMRDLVSVIVPVFERRRELFEALRSIVAQTYEDLEIIVVDDGSRTSLEDVVWDATRDSGRRVRFVRQENRGPGAARSRALQEAAGTLFQYLDSDDLLAPRKLERQVDALEEDRSAVMCYCGVETQVDGVTKGERLLSMTSGEDLLAMALQWRRWHTIGCLWRYPPALRSSAPTLWSSARRGEDLVHDVRVGVAARRVVHVPEILAKARAWIADGTRQVDPRSSATAVDQVSRECEVTLRRAGFLHRQPYATHFGERCLHWALSLLIWGDRRAAARLARLTRALLRSSEIGFPPATLPVVVNLAALDLPRYTLKRGARYLWRLHRGAVPAGVHCDRSLPPVLRRATRPAPGTPSRTSRSGADARELPPKQPGSGRSHE